MKVTTVKASLGMALALLTHSALAGEKLSDSQVIGTWTIDIRHTFIEVPGHKAISIAEALKSGHPSAEDLKLVKELMIFRLTFKQDHSFLSKDVYGPSLGKWQVQGSDVATYRSGPHDGLSNKVWHYDARLKLLTLRRTNMTFALQKGAGSH